ncbi:MAG: hypothetical protein GXO43_06120 [Crenarchaeota archaeon]|nr:hypothetical protein [Thermoproteota archaeon]
MARVTKRISKSVRNKLGRWFYGVVKAYGDKVCIEFHHVGRVSSYVKLKRNGVLVKNLEKLRYFGGYGDSLGSIMGLYIIACSKEGKGYYFEDEVEKKLGIPLYYW